MFNLHASLHRATIMTRLPAGYAQIAACILIVCLGIQSDAYSADLILADDDSQRVDDATKFRLFNVSASDLDSPDDVVVDIEVAITFSRLPDRLDNPLNPFYEDIRLGLLSPGRPPTFALLNYSDFDTRVPDPGFSGTLIFKNDATTKIGDSDDNGIPDGSIQAGEFRPSDDLAGWILGSPAAGLWGLTLSDRLLGTSLDYQSSEIRITTGPAPECQADCEISIDDLTDAIKNGGSSKFDVDQNGEVNLDDHRFWVETIQNTYFGDSNLDGQFNSSDFVTVFQAGEYEDNIPANSKWSTGDWNGDCEFDSGDFVLAFQSGGYEVGPRTSAASVPEPSYRFSVLILFSATLVQRIRFLSRHDECKAHATPPTRKPPTGRSARANI